MIRITAALILALCFAAPAEAHGHHYRHHHVAHRHSAPPGIVTGLGIGLAHMMDSAERHAGEVVSHPPGCPWRAFCGCGSSVEVYGHPVRELYLAANWLRFPRAMAAAGMAAVFGRHHVAVIRAAYGDGTAEVFDPNSGNHLTRVHRISIARATIVDPRQGLTEVRHARQHYQRFASRADLDGDRGGGYRDSRFSAFAY